MSVRNETGGLPNNTGSQIDGLSSNGEKNDGATFGQSLINFMTLATGSVKTALQKPANYKKNINHRRYLQKQLKICSRRKKRSTKAKTGPKNKKAVNKQVLGTASDVWLRQANCADIFVASEGSCSQEFPTNNLFFLFESSFSTLASGYRCRVWPKVQTFKMVTHGVISYIQNKSRQTFSQRNQWTMAVPSLEMIRYQLC